MKKIFLLLVLVLFITGCSSGVTKPVKNVNDFKTAASNKGFTVDEENKDYDGVSYIYEYGKIMTGESKVEMIVYSDSEKADAVQKTHIESFDLLKSTGAQAKREKGKNFYHYSLISNNKYMLSTRIDNTLIFCKVDLVDKDLIESLITELGY